MTPRSRTFWIVAALLVYAALGFSGVIDSLPQVWRASLNAVVVIALIVGVVVTVIELVRAIMDMNR